LFYYFDNANLPARRTGQDVRIKQKAEKIKYRPAKTAFALLF